MQRNRAQSSAIFASSCKMIWRGVKRGCGSAVLRTRGQKLGGSRSPIGTNITEVM
jgi:hypothetical protein